MQQPKAILPVQIEKTVIIAFIAKELKDKKGFHIGMASFCQGRTSHCNDCSV